MVYLSVLLAVAVLLTIILSVMTFFAVADKRRKGENKVKKVLGSSKENKKYVFNDYLFFDDCKVVQIDHIVVTPAGVFVIETKNLSGNIFGDDMQNNWLQSLSRGKMRTPFYSPVKQNKSHIVSLNKILPSETPTYSVVVFVSANIDNVKSEYACTLKDLKGIIKCKKKNLSIQSIKNVVKCLNKYKASGSMLLSQRSEKTRETQNKLANNICPLCNSDLILKRNGKESYYVCKNVECDYVRK